jgi:hypothetical protein
LSSRGAKSIQINGLVWMGEAALKQAKEEISAGFACEAKLGQ